MQLCLKEEVLSLKSRFFVGDAAGQERRAVQGGWEASGNKVFALAVLLVINLVLNAGIK